MLVVIDMTERVKVASEKQRVRFILMGKTRMIHGEKGKANKGYHNKTNKEIKSSL